MRWNASLNSWILLAEGKLTRSLRHLSVLGLSLWPCYVQLTVCVFELDCLSHFLHTLHKADDKRVVYDILFFCPITTHQILICSMHMEIKTLLDNVGQWWCTSPILYNLQGLLIMLTWWHASLRENWLCCFESSVTYWIQLKFSIAKLNLGISRRESSKYQSLDQIWLYCQICIICLQVYMY